MYPSAPKADNDGHDDPAAFWFARMNGGGPSLEDEAGYRAWLAADPSHVEAYRQCQAAWRDLGVEAAAPEMMALRSRALGADRSLMRRRAFLGLTGGALAASAAGVWVMTASSPARALIVTGAGQRLTAPLPDGSRVTLAPLSRLRLDFVRRRRAMTLESGQAWFDAVRDAQRPFSVLVGARSLSTEGGRFQITLADGAPHVVVEEGVLAFRPEPGRGETRLTAGQKATLSDKGMSIETADVETDTAWRLGRLVVRDRPLREVVVAFNRYSSDRLVLQDAQAGAVRISGSFRYDGAAEFAQALAGGFDLAVERQGADIWRIGTPDETTTLR